ncbi:glycosyltransferase family 1 protein, partial [bacterium]|nr:glycosyltransferase family 1 protein [bacterium]
MKVTFLTVMPSPYVQDLFAAMACDDRFDLRVLYMEQEAPDTYWGEQVMPD